MHSDAPLRAPFPYPGGKSRVADLVWSRLGNVSNYIEPFAGTLAVLLRRPADHFAGRYRVETTNDANHYLCNFWRAVRAAPDRVAEYADWIVTEADLHARHRWLLRSAESAEFRRRMVEDPDYYDPRIAGLVGVGDGLLDRVGLVSREPGGRGSYRRSSAADRRLRPRPWGDGGGLGRGSEDSQTIDRPRGEREWLGQDAASFGCGRSLAHCLRCPAGLADRLDAAAGGPPATGPHLLRTLVTHL